jgi:hypothetical protein
MPMAATSDLFQSISCRGWIARTYFLQKINGLKTAGASRPPQEIPKWIDRRCNEKSACHSDPEQSEGEESWHWLSSKYRVSGRRGDLW